jgi:hypothetical protein
METFTVITSRIIMFLCRSSTKWITADGGGAKKYEASTLPTCPEDASNWVDGTKPRKLFCGGHFHLVETISNSIVELGYNI